MYIKVTWQKFRDAVNDYSPAQFTKEGLGVLFDHFENLETNMDTKIELDVIEICNDWKEGTYEGLYGEDYPEDTNYEDFKVKVLEYLNHHTTVLKVGTDNLLIKNF